MQRHELNGLAHNLLDIIPMQPGAAQVRGLVLLFDQETNHVVVAGHEVQICDMAGQVLARLFEEVRKRALRCHQGQGVPS